MTPTERDLIQKLLATVDQLVITVLSQQKALEGLMQETEEHRMVLEKLCQEREQRWTANLN